MSLAGDSWDRVTLSAPADATPDAINWIEQGRGDVIVAGSFHSI